MPVRVVVAEEAMAEAGGGHGGGGGGPGVSHGGGGGGGGGRSMGGAGRHGGGGPSMGPGRSMSRSFNRGPGVRGPVARNFDRGPAVRNFNRGPEGRGPRMSWNKGDGRRHGHGRRFRGGYFAAAPYFYGNSYYDYGYSGGCGWLYRRAVETGSPYWWRRYEDCID